MGQRFQLRLTQDSANKSSMKLPTWPKMAPRSYIGQKFAQAREQAVWEAISCTNMPNITQHSFHDGWVWAQNGTLIASTHGPMQDGTKTFAQNLQHQPLNQHGAGGPRHPKNIVICADVCGVLGRRFGVAELRSVIGGGSGWRFEAAVWVSELTLRICDWRYAAWSG